MSNVFLDTFLASDLSADICFRNEFFFFLSLGRNDVDSNLIGTQLLEFLPLLVILSLSESFLDFYGDSGGLYTSPHL